MAKLICKFQDDNGTVCNKTVSKKQWQQDGMCSRCADLIWNNYCLPMSRNIDTIPIVFPTISNTDRKKNHG